jgi:hypothetical protein
LCKAGNRNNHRAIEDHRTYQRTNPVHHPLRTEYCHVAYGRWADWTIGHMRFFSISLQIGYWTTSNKRPFQPMNFSKYMY